MTTYIQKKERLFREAGDNQVDIKRSFARLKRYDSCTDRRAWAISDEERRQHILEIIKSKNGKSLSLGKYIPIEVLIDLLLATKNAEIERLLKKIAELEKLLELYDQLDLTDEQKRKLQGMKQQVLGSAGDLESMTSGSYYETDDESTQYGAFDPNDPPRSCASGGGGVVQVKYRGEHGEDDETPVDEFETGSQRTTDLESGPHVCASMKPLCTDSKPNIGAGNVGPISLNLDVRGDVDDIEIELTDMENDSEEPPESYDTMDVEQLRSLLEKKDIEISELKEQLRCHVSAAQYGMTANLQQQLTHSQLALVSAQQEKAQLARAITCGQSTDLNKLEEEIAQMRECPDLSPEQETEIIKKELDVLKKYCDKLSNIQEENDQLKFENDRMRRELGPDFDISKLKQRSALLDTVVDEKKALQKQLSKLDDIDGEMQTLRRRSQAVEQDKARLLDQLNEVNKCRRQSDFMVDDLKNENEEMARNMEKLRAERDELRNKLAEMGHLEMAYNEMQKQNVSLQRGSQENAYACSRMNDELSRLRTRAKEADILRLERDRMQLRIEELSALEVEVLTLVEQVKSLSIERDVLARQACDFHCIIADQEMEIKALLLHVDRLSQSVEKQQDKIRSALDEMQGELERKNSMLASSDEQLADISNQKSCLAQIENDLRRTINELKSELNEKDDMIKSLQSHIVGCPGQSGSPDLINKMSDELKTCRQENQRLQTLLNQLQCVCNYNHVDTMLQESKEAVGIVINEVQNYLESSPDSDDQHLVAENRQLRKNSMDVQNMARQKVDELTEELQLARQENCDLRAENDLLKSMTKGIETDLKILNSQLEEPMTSSASDRDLRDQLEMCRHANEELEYTIEELRQAAIPPRTCNCQIKLKEEMEVYQAKIAALEATVAELRSKLGNTCDEDDSDKDLKLQLDLCRSANVELELTINNLRKNSEKSTNAEEQLEIECVMRQSLEEENGVLKEELEEKSALVQKLSVEMEKIPGQTMELLSSVSQQFKEETDNLRAENAELKNTINQLEEELHQYIEMSMGIVPVTKAPSKCRCEECEDQDICDLKTLNLQLQEQVCKLQNEIKRFSSQMSENSLNEDGNDIKQLKYINKALEEQISELKREVNRLSELHCLTTGPQTQIAITGNTGNMGNIEIEIEDLPCDQLRSKIKTLMQEVENLREFQVGDCTEVDHLKQIIIQQEREIDDFKKNIRELTTALKDCENMVSLPQDERTQKLVQEIEDLKCENNCLRMCLTSTSPTDENAALGELDIRDGNRLRAEVEDLKSQLECARSCQANTGSGDVDRLQAENDQLQQTIQKLQQQIENLNRMLDEAQCAAMQGSDLEEEVNHLRVMIAELQRENSTLISQLNESAEKIKALEDRTKQLEEEKADLEARIETHKREQRELLERLEQCVNRSSAQEGEMEAQICKLKQRIQQLEGLNKALQDQLAACKQKLDDTINNKLKELMDKIAQLEADKAHMEARIQKLMQEQEEVSNKFQEHIRASAAKEIELESEICRLKAKLKALEEVISTLEIQLKEATCMFESEKLKSLNLEKQLACCGVQRAGLQTEVDQLRKRLSDLDRELVALRGQAGKLGASAFEIDNLRCEIMTLKKMLEQCKEEMAKSRSQLDALRAENAALKKEMADLLDKMQAGDHGTADRQDIDALNALIKKLEQQLRDCEAKGTRSTGDLDDELRRLREENERLRKEKEDELRALQEQFEKNLALAKEQYNRDLEFVHGRHSEGIVRLQDMHEGTVGDTVKQYEVEIENLQKQLAELAKQKKACEDSLKSKQDEIDSLKQQLANERNRCEEEMAKLRKSIENDLKLAQAEIARLKQELEAAQKCCADVERLKKELEACNANLSGMNKRLEDELAKLRKDLENEKNKGGDELNKLKNDLENERQRAQDEINKLKADFLNEKKRLEDELARLRQEADKNKKCCDDLESMKRDLEKLNGNADNAIKQAQSELAKAKQDLENERKRHEDEMNKLRADCQNEKKRLEDEIAKLKKDIEQFKRCCDELEKLKKDLSRDNKDLETDLEETNRRCQEELAKLKKEQEAAKKRYEEDLAKLRKEMEEYKKCCDELDMVKKELDKQKQLLKGAGDSNKVIEEELSKMKKDLENERKRHEDEMNKLKAELQNEKKRLEDEIARLLREMEASKRCCEELEKAKKDLEKANNDLKNMANDAKQRCDDELARLRKELENARQQLLDELARLKKELADEKKLNAELERAKNELEKANKDLKSKVDEAGSHSAGEIASLKSELENAKKRYESEIAKLKEELEKAKKCCDDLDKMKRDLESRNKDLKSNVTDTNRQCEDELANLRREAENDKKRCADEISKLKKDLENERKRLEDEIARLKRELDQQQKCCDELERMKRDLERGNKDLKGNISDSRDQADEELAKLRKELERTKARLEEEIARLKKELEAQAKCCDELEKVKRDLERANKGLKSGTDDSNKQHNEEMADLKKELADTKKRYEEKLDKLKQELEDQKKSYEAEISRLKSELAKGKKCCEDLEELQMNLENEKKRLQKQIDDLKKELENDRKRFGDEIADLKAELAKSKKCCSELEDLKVELENEKKKCEREMARLKKELEDEKQRLSDELAELKKSLGGDKNKREEELDKLRKELENQKKCCDDLEKLKNELASDLAAKEEILRKQFEDEINKWKKEAEKNKKCCDDLEKAKKDIANEKKRCEDEMAKLRKSLEEKKKCCDELEKLKNGLMGDANEYIDEINRLKKELEKGKKCCEDLEKAKSEQNKDRKRLEDEIEKLKKQLEKEKKCCAELEKIKKDMRKEFEDEIKRLKKEVEKGRKCCEDLEKCKRGLLGKLDDEKTARRSLQRSLDEIGKIKDDMKDAGTQEPIVKAKVCPCGALAKNLPRTSLAAPAPPPAPRMSIPSPALQSQLQQCKKCLEIKADKEKKLQRLSKATALIVDMQQGTSKSPPRLLLSKKTIVITNLEPAEPNKHLVSLEEEKQIQVSKSIENILTKALKTGLENLSFEELQDLYLKTLNAASSYEPSLKLQTPSMSESEVALSKLPLQRRISSLETELAKRQQFATEKMHELENAVFMERQQLVEMKNALVSERKRNNELAVQLGWQTREITSERDVLKRRASFLEQRLQQLSNEVEEERCRSCTLRQDLEKAKKIEEDLIKLLEEARGQRQSTSSDTIEMLQAKLDKTLTLKSKLKSQMTRSSTAKGASKGSISPYAAPRRDSTSTDDDRRTRASTSKPKRK